MRIGELARRTGVSIRSLRYYDNMGLLGAQRLENGYREFDESAVRRVQEISALLEVGFTVKEIQQIAHCLGDPVHGHQLCEVARNMHRDKLNEIRNRILQLEKISSRIAVRIAGEGDETA